MNRRGGDLEQRGAGTGERWEEGGLLGERSAGAVSIRRLGETISAGTKNDYERGATSFCCSLSSCLGFLNTATSAGTLFYGAPTGNKIDGVPTASTVRARVRNARLRPPTIRNGKQAWGTAQPSRNRTHPCTILCTSPPPPLRDRRAF